MSSLSPIKRSRGEAERGLALSAWLRPLAVLSALISAERLGGQLAPHVGVGGRLFLAFSAALFVWALTHARLRPPSDPLSRLRASLTPEGRLIGLSIASLLCVASAWNLWRLQQRLAPLLSPERVLSYAPLPEGTCRVSGAPYEGAERYRWDLEGVTSDEGEGWVSEDAPYLTPLTEFKGQLLVITSEPLTTPLSEHKGRLLEAREVAQGSFMSYRSALSVPREAPIYLVDLRAAPWFDLKGLIFSLWSLTLLIGFWSSPTRDPKNQLKGLYIPPELREGLEESGADEADEPHKEP